MLKKDLTGQTFNRLTVIEAVDGKWLCRCQCGSLRTVEGGNLRSGHTKSCGCIRVRHGAATHTAKWPEYRIYTGAKYRCERPSNKAYVNYGGRGIEFRFKSFEEFFQHLGRRPSSTHTLERINNDGHYEPGNVRWATRLEQALNLRRNRRVEWQGRSLTISQWAAEIGLRQNSLAYRIDHPELWCIPCAVTKPAYARCSHRD